MKLTAPFEFVGRSVARLTSSKISGLKRMRISQERGYRCEAFDCDGNFITSIYDSGFRDLYDIKWYVEQAAKRYHRTVCSFSVYCVDDDTYSRYRIIGNKIVKE